MISVVDKEMIRKLYHVQRKSIRWIARELGLARQTVKKAIQNAEPPEYKLTKPRPQPVVGQIKSIVEQWLEEDKNSPPKQHHTGHRIHERLVEEYNYQGSESGIRRLLGQLRRKEKETYVPLEFLPGTNAQCDWCEVTIILAEERILAQVFLLRLGNSRMPFVMVFPNQRQEAFFEGMRHAFSFWEGIPRSITFDNLKAAVYKVLQGKNRIEQNNFINFRSHYLFESRYCNPGRGNEKGGVENLAGFVERNFFTPLPQADTWTEINNCLLGRCLQYAKTHQVPGTKISIEEAWQIEKKHLLPLPKRQFDCCRRVEVEAAKNQLVRFENNFYSVPGTWVGQRLSLKAYVYQVDIYSNRLIIASHRRSYEKGEELYNLDHYLETLYKKPGALEDAKPFKRAKLPDVYQKYLDVLKQHHRQPEREFVQVLMFHRETSWETLTSAMKEALRQGIYQSAGVKQILERITGKHLATTPFTSSRYPHLVNYKVDRPRVSKFDQLLGQPGVMVH
ncbi:MAG: Integrase core domain-containing protein [Desulfotomaculum sp. 46_296]|nr:MAG: Integrase core domain-containing protein [Desulfotomaculum sp. 46_296]